MSHVKIIYGIAIMIMTIGLISCNKTNFSGKSKKSTVQPVNNVILLDARGIDSNTDAGTGNGKENDTVNVVISGVGSFNSEIAVAKNIPIDLVFVIDSSLSMADEIESVRTTAINLVGELRKKQIDLNVGAVGFIDTLASIDERLVNLTGDITAFTSDFNSKLTLATLYNADMPEASQLAARKGLSLLSKGRPGAVKALILITDVVGHNGHPEQLWEGQGDIDESKTDCTTTALTGEVNTMITSGKFLPSLFKFYYLVPTVENTVPGTIDRRSVEHKCESNKLDINTQMDEVIKTINTGAPEASRGGSLGELNGLGVWPFDSASLTEALIPVLTEEVTKMVNKSCYAKNVKIYRDNKAEYEWKANSIDEIKKVPNNEILIPKVSELKGMNADAKIDINIARCCFNSVESALDLNACDQDYQQNFSFLIKKL